ncbi:MAG: rhodanese-like domain-containing protein [Rhodocyclaceae bacterium]|jgi:rhodanese-related sulfurtransferase
MEFVLHNYIWIALALVSGGLLLGPMIRGGSRFGVAPTQAVTLINRNDAVIVDVREQKEFEAGHLPNARHIPAGELAERTGELARFKNRPIVVVCQSGTRANGAVSTLRKAGYEQAFTLDGGVAAWLQAGFPLSTKA